MDLSEPETAPVPSAPAPAPEPDLEFSGRDTNRALGFRRWNASAHASYYTPAWLCEAIAKGLDEALCGPHGEDADYFESGRDVRRAYSSEGERKLHVLDPTCGSGRFLLPFAALGHHVMGIELDAASVAVAKKNLGAKCVRAGDLLLYAGLLRNQTYEEGGYHVVVTNPPYGIWWDVPDSRGWAVSRDEAVKLESQAVTLETSVRSLAHKGILVAVIPTATFTNEKDAPLREFLAREVRVLSRTNLPGLFEDEYGIAVNVDLVIASKESFYFGGFSTRSPFDVTDAVDCKASDAPAEVAAIVRRSLAKWVPPTTKPGKLPAGDLFVSIPVNRDIEITPRGPAGSTSARAMLDFLDATCETYNPVQGVLTGVAEAYLSAPALLLRGYDEGLSELAKLGFEPTIAEATKRRLDSLRRSFARRVVPLYRPRPHQLLGHFAAKAHEATHDVAALLYYRDYRDRDERKVEPWIDGKHGTLGMPSDYVRPETPTVLWKAGSSYRIEPTWIRKRETAETHEEEKKGKPVFVTVDIDRGYLLLRVETEAGWLDVPEMDETRVKLFLKAFPLPAVEDVDDLFPDEIERNRQTLQRQSPHLFPYQLEDAARLVSKPRGFLAFDVGGGKTAVSVAWAKARGYRRSLVICESRLIDNWLAESRKFGFEAYRLDTHSAVSELRQRIAAGEKPSGFFVTSYEFLALDGSRTYHPWDCEKFDKKGDRIHHEAGNTGETCRSCDSRVSYDACPKCEASYSEGWGGAACACGFVAFTYDGTRRQSAAYRRMAKLFPCVIADEAQVGKAKLSRRGQALRAMRSKGRLVLTATLFKGYITDTYWVLSWILGWDNPLFPYSYRGGAKRFLDCYATYKFVTRRFEETLHVGKAQLLPEVSSLNLFARMMAPFMVRRIDGEMAVLPARHRHVEILPMEEEQSVFYRAYETWAKDKISNELKLHQDEDVNMGVISQCLWTLRFAATVPTATDNIHRTDSPRLTHSGLSWAKLARALAIVREALAAGEKVVLTAPLRPMVAALGEALKAAGIPFVSILGGTPVESRHGIVARFNVDSDTPVLLAAMGAITRGLNITGASRIVVCAVEWSPESLTQVCGRLHRPGQLREVHEHVLLSYDTIDVAMYDLCNAKESALREAMDGRVRYQKTAAVLAAVESNAQMAVARALVRGR